MDTITQPTPHNTASADPGAAVIAAARVLATRMKHTPQWADRLLPQARALVEAVDAYDQAVTRS